MPESARISPVRGRTTAMPPSRPVSASTAAICTLGAIDVRTAGAASAMPAPRSRPPARSTPPGCPRSSLVEDPLQAAHADLRVGRDALRAQLGRPLLRDRAQRARDRARGRERGRTRLALGERRAVAREQVGAPGQVRPPGQRLAVAQPRERSRRAHAMRGRSSPVRTGTRIVAGSSRRPGCSTVTGSSTIPSCGRPARPPGPRPPWPWPPRRGSARRTPDGHALGGVVGELGVHRPVVAPLHASAKRRTASRSSAPRPAATTTPPANAPAASSRTGRSRRARRLLRGAGRGAPMASIVHALRGGSVRVAPPRHDCRA